MARFFPLSVNWVHWAFGLILLFFAAAASACQLHVLGALEHPEQKLVFLEESREASPFVREFPLLLASICGSVPCGVDPVHDSKSRDHVNQWLKTAEALRGKEKEVLILFVKNWLRNTVTDLRHDPEKTKPFRTSVTFFEARLKEKKSSLRDLFCIY